MIKQAPTARDYSDLFSEMSKSNYFVIKENSTFNYIHGQSTRSPPGFSSRLLKSSSRKILSRIDSTSDIEGRSKG